MPWHDEEGGVVGTLGISRDITQSKRAEEALQQSEATYRSLVEHAVFGIYRSTLDGRMVAANPALVEMLGYGSEEELRAQDMKRNIYADPEERERLIARYRDAERYEGVETEWKRKNGTSITVRLSGRPVRGPDRTLDGFEMVVEDLTERRALEAQLRQAQKMEAIGQLAGGVAHDFNNLLTAVLTSCDLLGAELPEDSPLRDDVDAICSAGQRGAELTRKLLAFSRKQPLELRTVSLATVANDFLAMGRRVVPEDVNVAVHVDAPDTTAHADSGALEQILMNLVTNARDATPAGGRILIEVGRRALDEEHRRVYGWGRPGEYVTLTVSDTGSGMDAVTQRRIFEPFFTTKPVGQGTGLGMAMVYGLVKQHEGYVHVYSEVGQGTAVRVYLPAVTGQGAEPARPARLEMRGGSETILLVEDDADVRRAATRVLEKFGYTVLTAADGYEALAVLEKREAPPDLIVSDVVMPRISGPHLVSKLREGGMVPRVLFTSGYTARDVVERAQLEPGVPFLAKPWTVTDLLRKVRQVLDGPAVS
jgi:PAS domain S-box-containing protein